MTPAIPTSVIGHPFCAESEVETDYGPYLPFATSTRNGNTRRTERCGFAGRGGEAALV
jgi:hypothetical protein